MNNPLITPLSAKDFESDADVKWCPGCGDYAILKQIQNTLPKLGIRREDTVFVSGIGCSGRLPYYMNTYGLHTIHGRSLAVASGIKIANPDLHIWVITGDGDGFSIGLNHTLQAVRRNFNLNVLLFNNRIYGLTKGQFSPTSEQAKNTKSSPLGSLEPPIQPLALVLNAGGTFVARALDRNVQHLQKTLLQVAAHKGTSFLEIYQNCNIFNDKAFDMFFGKEQNDVLFLEEGQPLIFGKTRNKGIRLTGHKAEVVAINESEWSENDLWIHDTQDKIKAQILLDFSLIARENAEALPEPFGVFYQTQKPCYEQLLHEQKAAARQQKAADLSALLKGEDFWEIT